MTASRSLIAVLRLLRRHRRWTTSADVARAIGVSRRTAQLQLAVLSAAGVILRTHEGAGRTATEFRWAVKTDASARRFVQRVEVLAS